MAKKNGGTVVALESHPLWCGAQRRSQELRDAMRRHPSYMGADEPGLPDRSDAVVRSLRLV